MIQCTIVQRRYASWWALCLCFEIWLQGEDDAGQVPAWSGHREWCTDLPSGDDRCGIAPVHWSSNGNGSWSRSWRRIWKQCSVVSQWAWQVSRRLQLSFGGRGRVCSINNNGSSNNKWPECHGLDHSRFQWWYSLARRKHQGSAAAISVSEEQSAARAGRWRNSGQRCLRTTAAAWQLRYHSRSCTHDGATTSTHIQHAGRESQSK